ncbi:MAG: transposase [Candidatus Omnitrophota bacterium]|nr:transposase [Candidatus Omnitrophota bacterium]
MARQLRIEYEGAFYHVIQRGIERRNIFASDSDKYKFLSYLDFAHTGYGAIIHSYVLMNNHYHIIMETPQANLSKIMHYLNASYASYYNAKRKRAGPLYQGRYKAILVEQNAYLHQLSRYIHLNPVRVNIVEDPKDYPWSSYRFFVLANPPRWLKTSPILSMFDDNILKAKRLYNSFVFDGMGQELDFLKKNTIKGIILGSEKFAQVIINRFIHDDEDPEIPAVKQLKQRNAPTLEKIEEAVEGIVSDNRKLQRKFCLYLSRRYTPKTLKEIAAFYGKIKDSGVSQSFAGTEKARGEDKDINRLLSMVETAINV